MLKILLGQSLFLIISGSVNHRYPHCSTDSRKDSAPQCRAGSCSNIALFVEDSGKQQTKSVSECLLDAENNHILVVTSECPNAHLGGRAVPFVHC